jgi:hypothetical protein
MIAATMNPQVDNHFLLMAHHHVNNINKNNNKNRCNECNAPLNHFCRKCKKCVCLVCCGEKRARENVWWCDTCFKTQTVAKQQLIRNCDYCSEDKE